MRAPLRHIITTGDADGIGTEVTSKALRSVGQTAGIQFYLWRSPRIPQKHLQRIDRSFTRITVQSWPQALDIESRKKNTIVDINSTLNPAKWVEVSAAALSSGQAHALTTAPLSKLTIRDAGLDDLGHTEILSRVSKSGPLHMGFLGRYFNVVLATGHCPLSQVSKELTAENLLSAIHAANALRLSLGPKVSRLPVAVLGLNPHAGEKGLIGVEEQGVYSAAFMRAKSLSIPFVGPLVPDAAFSKDNWKRYSVFVAAYHDQGLIPFKSFHGHRDGVHITLGLPFIRTSVDHGTAKDLFKKEVAENGSMKQALMYAIKLAKEKFA